MSPSPTGSVRPIPTMGIVPVAFFAARTPGVGDAAIHLHEMPRGVR